MFRLILKTLWSRRKRNAWLLAELILVCVLSWVVFDPVIVITHERAMPLGYDADRLSLVSLDVLRPSAPGYDSLSNEPDARMDAYLSFIDRVRQHPDVEQATALLGFSYPSSQGSNSNGFRVDGDTVKNNVSVFITYFLPHTHFFETYGFRPGKGITPAQLSDYTYEPNSLVLDEHTLDYYFHSDDPRGKRLWTTAFGDTTRYSVVGTVGTFKYRSDQRPRAVVFQPGNRRDMAGYVPGDAKILVRIKEGVSMDRFLHDFKPWMLQNLRAGNLYARDVSTYNQLIDESEYYTSTTIYRLCLLVAVFFLINLCLGVAGTFWLQTRTRREEIGVMLSFGGRPGHIVRLMLGEGAVLTTIATAVGCFLYLQFALSEGLSNGVTDFGFMRQEYWTDYFGWHFLIVSLIIYAILLVVVSIGVYLPARHISRIQPTEALRDE